MGVGVCMHSTPSTSGTCRSSLSTPSSRQFGMLRSNRRPVRYVVRASSGPDNQGDETAETLFQKELRRRGIQQGAQGSEQKERTTTSTESRPWEPPVQPREDQFQKSRALVNEGLEGLIPRASELIKLGGTFFLAFLPLIIVVGAITTGIYLFQGDAFIHRGAPAAEMPKYIDPYELLNEGTIDPMIPLR